MSKGDAVAVGATVGVGASVGVGVNVGVAVGNGVGVAINDVTLQASVKMRRRGKSLRMGC